MAPPITGPSTGPSSAGMVTTDSAPTNSLRGVVRSRTSRPTGISVAPAAPWMKRKRINCQSAPAKPQAADPAAYSTIEDMKTRRAPNRSAIQPESGRKIAADRR